MKKSVRIIYGFVDESGTAGATRSKKEYLVASLIIFKNEKEKRRVREEFIKLRQKLNIKQNYEFHYSRNKLLVRNAVFEVIKNLNFNFMTFAILKDDVKSHASYAVLAEKIIGAVKRYNAQVNITIDTNPVLFKELKRQKRTIMPATVKIGQANSIEDDGIQLADYIVSSHAKIIKGLKETNFGCIKNKLIKTEIIKYS